MNEKGAIPILILLQLFAPILFVIVGLIVAGIMFTFFKSLAIASILGVIGGVLIWKYFGSLDKKTSQMALGIGFILVLVALFIGVATPFSVVGTGVVSSQSFTILDSIKLYLNEIMKVVM